MSVENAAPIRRIVNFRAEAFARFPYEPAEHVKVVGGARAFSPSTEAFGYPGRVGQLSKSFKFAAFF